MCFWICCHQLSYIPKLGLCKRFWCNLSQYYSNSFSNIWCSFMFKWRFFLSISRNNSLSHCRFILCSQISRNVRHNWIHPTWTILNVKLDSRCFWKDQKLWTLIDCCLTHLHPDVLEHCWINWRRYDLSYDCYFLHDEIDAIHFQHWTWNLNRSIKHGMCSFGNVRIGELDFRYFFFHFNHPFVLGCLRWTLHLQHRDRRRSWQIPQLLQEECL